MTSIEAIVMQSQKPQIWHDNYIANTKKYFSPTSPRMSRLVLIKRDEKLIYSHTIDYPINAANIFRKLGNKVFFCGAFGFAAQGNNSVASNNGSSYGACWAMYHKRHFQLRGNRRVVNLFAKRPGRAGYCQFIFYIVNAVYIFGVFRCKVFLSLTGDFAF